MNKPADDTILAFKTAVERSDAETVKALLAADPALRAAIDEPWFAFDAPAIVFAAGRRSRPVLEALLDGGANIEAESEWKAGGFTALHCVIGAAGSPNDDIAEFLIERGATIDLHAAAGLGRRDLLAECLDRTPERVDEPGPDGVTPLHLARTPEIADFLLTREAPLEKRDLDHNSTPAMWAVRERLDVLRFLLERGAGPDIFMAAVLDDIALAEGVIARTDGAVDHRIGEGLFAHPPSGGDIYIWQLDFADTPAEVARRRGHESIYTWLLERSAFGTRVVQACRREDEAALRTLVAEKPAAFDELSRHDHFASFCSSPHIIDVVVELGGNVDATDEGGETALHDAAWRGHLDRIKALVDHGADATRRDGNFHSSPFAWAKHNERHDVVEYLVTHANLDVADLAAAGATERLAAALDTDPSLVDGSAPNWNPLRSAAWTGQMECVKLLLARGADPLKANAESGQTAAAVARERGHEEIAKLIE